MKDKFLEEFRRDFTSASGAGGKASLLGTWRAYRSEWFGDSLPIYSIVVRAMPSD